MANINQDVDWQVTLLGEALLLELLSRAIRDVPDADWLHTLAVEDVFSEPPLEGSSPAFAEGQRLLVNWTQAHRESIPADEMLDLCTDHTHLFSGPGKPIAPPWESVYFNEDRMIFQEQTAQVRGWYRSFGLESEKVYQEPDDHIGLELSFLAALARKGIEALEMKDDARFQEYLQAQKDFLFQHPIQWVHIWSGLVDTHAKTDLYRGFAKMIHGSLLTLADMFGVEAPKESVP